jgi:uncharacterized DUF497 family protein
MMTYGKMAGPTRRWFPGGAFTGKSTVRFEFDWDAAKAETNRIKYNVSFDEAMAVFRDPLAISRLDEDHGAADERWVTIGQGWASRVILVVHTYIETGADRVAIRIISARPPTKREERQYEDGTLQ